MATQKNSRSKDWKNNKKGKGYSNSYQDDRDSKVDKKDFKSKGCNDISWYAQDATLLKNTANFPWSTQTGLTYDDYKTVILPGNNVDRKLRKYTSPGILALRVLPGLGNTAYELDAVNVAANAMYVFIRHMNSGAKNYDAPDLMNYILAMDEVFTAINFAQRLYGTLGMYSVYNRYTPDTLIRMQGISPDDLRENMVNFRYRLNTIIKQASTLVVPNTFPIFLRHSFLFSNYYVEGNDMKDQMYLYTPLNFRKFNIPAGGGPGELIYDELKTGSVFKLDPNTPITGDELLDYIQDMVQRIYLDEDFGIMAGDILKAYGEGSVVRLSELPDSYVCSLQQNNEVLLQMKNCNVAGSAWRNFDYAKRTSSDPHASKFGNIYQDPNSNRIREYLTITMSASDPFEAIDYDFHLLTLEGEPSPEMNMVMTRCTHDYILSSNVDQIVYLCGSELVCAISVASDVDPLQIFTISQTLPFSDITEAQFASDMTELLSQFKYHPAVYLIPEASNPPTSAADIKRIARLYQVDNFTMLTRDMLDRLNQVAIMSEFNVPHMALIK